MQSPFGPLRAPLRGPRLAAQNTTPPVAMAIYHCSVKAVSRSAGRSAVAAAAYRAGAKLTDHRTGEVADYTRKRGVESAFILAPAAAPAWTAEREQLWNQAEAAETRKNSTVAREWEIALPAELDAAGRRELAEAIGSRLVERYGIALDVALHEPGKEGDQRNYHAHMLGTTRRMTPIGLGEKTRELDDKKRGPDEVAWCREMVARETNAVLQRYGQAARVDHRSLADQGKPEQMPTPHLGPHATAVERKTKAPSRIREDAWAKQREYLRQRAIEAAQAKHEEAEAFAKVSRLEMALRAEKQALRAAVSPQRTAAELAAELRAVRAGLPDFKAEIDRAPAVVATRDQVHAVIAKRRDQAARRDELARQLDQAKTVYTEARKQRDQWRQAHPWRAWLYDKGARWAAQPLADQAAQIERLRQAGWKVQQQHDQAQAGYADIEREYQAAGLAHEQAARAEQQRLRERYAPQLALRDQVQQALGVATQREAEEQRRRQEAAQREALARQAEIERAAAAEEEKLRRQQEAAERIKTLLQGRVVAPRHDDDEPQHAPRPRMR